MNNQSFTTTLLVGQNPEEVFNAINNPRGWWSEEIEGSTNKPNDEFSYHYFEIHRSKMKIIEFIPNQKVVWLVMDNYFNFTQDKTEWTGTKIIFEISELDKKTQIRFTHLGLVARFECFNVCSIAWDQYIQVSLKGLITSGKGKPNSRTNQGIEHEKQLQPDHK